MLVMSRAVNEAVVIDVGPNAADVIVVRVLGVRNGIVRIGIECDRRISIRRQELPPLPRHDAEDRAFTGIPQGLRCGVCGSMSVRKSSMMPGKVLCNDCGKTSVGVQPPQ